MGWLGLDDTDHLGGGCTTWTLQQLVSSLPTGVSVAGDPCLVRLYPMAKGRTRGNAALAVELDVRLDHASWHTWLEQYWGAHLSTLAGRWTPSTHAARKQVPSDPGLVWFETKPSPDFYRQAVTEEVTLDDVPDASWSAGGLGIIGATAAVAWPLEVSTWEGIAWRQGHDTPRRLDEGIMVRLDRDPRLVACRDPRKGRSLLAPRGTSPVLFGLRGTDRSAVEQGVRDLVERRGQRTWPRFASSKPTKEAATTYRLPSKQPWKKSTSCVGVMLPLRPLKARGWRLRRQMNCGTLQLNLSPATWCGALVSSAIGKDGKGFTSKR